MESYFQEKNHYHIVPKSVRGPAYTLYVERVNPSAFRRVLKNKVEAKHHYPSSDEQKTKDEFKDRISGKLMEEVAIGSYKYPWIGARIDAIY